MSATTQFLLEELENIETDIVRAKAANVDPTYFEQRRRELVKRLDEMNQQLEQKQLLKG